MLGGYGERVSAAKFPDLRVLSQFAWDVIPDRFSRASIIATSAMLKSVLLTPAAIAWDKPALMLAAEIVPNEIERERVAVVLEFLLKALVSRVNRRMDMRIVRI